MTIDRRGGDAPLSAPDAPNPAVARRIDAVALLR
jgi:hypothetical protein